MEPQLIIRISEGGELNPYVLPAAKIDHEKKIPREQERSMKEQEIRLSSVWQCLR
jgi:hypothetical protein